MILPRRGRQLDAVCPINWSFAPLARLTAWYHADTPGWTCRTLHNLARNGRPGDIAAAATNLAWAERDGRQVLRSSLTAGTGQVAVTAYPSTSVLTIETVFRPLSITEGYGAVFTQGTSSGLYWRSLSTVQLYPAVADTTTITPGTWNHVFISHDGTNTRYCINGVFSSTNTNASGISWLIDGLMNNSGSETFDGDFLYLRYWAGVALPDEVGASLYRDYCEDFRYSLRRAGEYPLSYEEPAAGGGGATVGKLMLLGVGG